MYDEEGNEVLLVQTVTFGKTTAIDNTRDDLYLGTWIAETTIIHPNSDLIKQQIVFIGSFFFECCSL